MEVDRLVGLENDSQNFVMDKYNRMEIYRYLISKYPKLVTIDVAKYIMRFKNSSLEEDMLSVLQSEKQDVLQELYQHILGRQEEHALIKSSGLGREND